MGDAGAGPDAVQVRALRASEVTALTALFQRCYGDSYGNRLFYDGGALAAALAAGTLRSVVAVAPDGTLLGHTAMTIVHPGARICETGNTVVDPAARGRGLLRLLGEGLRQRVLGDGFAGYVHYPTTAHEIMQRAAVAGGGCELGVMLSYIAETTEYAAVDRPPGRLAATVVYQPLAGLPERRVCVPARYRTLLADLYAQAGLRRRIAAEAAPSTAGRGSLETAWNPQRGLLRIVVHRVGDDLADLVFSEVDETRPAVTHLDLALNRPDVEAAVAALAPLGFVFCALLPEFAHTDVLRLQRLRERAGRVFFPAVVNPGARRLCRVIRREAGLRG